MWAGGGAEEARGGDINFVCPGAHSALKVEKPPQARLKERGGFNVHCAYEYTYVFI